MVLMGSSGEEYENKEPDKLTKKEFLDSLESDKDVEIMPIIRTQE